MEACLVLNDKNDIHGGTYEKELYIIVGVIVGLQLPGELPRCNLKPAPLYGRQGETEGRGRPLQIGTWQVL